MSDPQLPSPTGDADAAPASAWYALFVLTILLVFATVDRAILSLQAETIKKVLDLSDLQLGLMQGTGIAIFAALASFPIAWLADKFGRKPVLAGSVIVWSSAVVGCAFAQSFPQMMLASAMVGAGEAGLGPISYALIAELFRGSKRQTANSVFVVAGATGGGLALVITGQLIGAAEMARPLLPLALQGLDGWRISFLLAAMPAPLMLLLIWTIPHIKRASAQLQRAAATVVESALTLRQHLRQHRTTLFPFFFGVASAIFAFSAIGAWLPVIGMRLFGQTAQQLGNVMAAIGIGSIVIGFAFTTFIVRRFGPRLGSRLQVRTLWLSTMVAITTSAAMGFATSAQHVYMIQAIQAVMFTAANMMYPTALQDLAPAHLRGRVVAVQSTINVIFAAAAAPTVGFISDRMSHRPDSLLVAASGVAVAGLIASTLLLRWSERGYSQTIADVARAEASHTELTQGPQPLPA